MQQGSSPKAPAAAPRIDPELWTHFAQAETREAYCHRWLSLQCALIPEVRQGIVVLEDGAGGTYAPVAQWPDSGGDPQRLAEISARVCEERCGLLEALTPSDGSIPIGADRYAVGYPILVQDRLQGAIALEVSAASEQQLTAVMEQLQWGASWMELLFRRMQVREGEASLSRLKSAVEMMAGVLSEEGYQSACMAFVTEMAVQLDCERVSIAVTRGKKAKIQAVSHSAQTGERMNLIRAIGQAMDESILQRKEVFFPPAEGGPVLITRDHENLSEQHGAGAILTIPFFGEKSYRGAMTLERPARMPFTEEEARFCRSVGSLLFPVLDAKRKEDRSFLLKMGDAVREQAVRWMGPSYVGRKLLLVALIAVVVFFSHKTGEYRISADTVVEGAIHRVVVAPFDGYVKETQARAGDIVEESELLCRLDDRELRLERLSWLSKRAQYQRQYQEALAAYDRAQANIIKAQLEQATAKLNLAESQIERTRIAAPFDGIVIRDNLVQRLGGAVEKGEVLFEVAPLDAYRIVLQVDESRIADVAAGQEGRLLLSAFPTEPVSFVVDKITPITQSREGRNTFRVEALPEDAPAYLRPGMEGVGKIFVDRRNLFFVWTRDFRDWFRLWWWSWWP